MPPKGTGRGARRGAGRGVPDPAAESSTPGPSATTPSSCATPAATAAASAPPPSTARNTPHPRGQVQRLQSLKRRPPAGSLVPLNPDGTTPKPTLKYQPKAVQRRSKEERQEIERLEAERRRERIAEAETTRRRPAASAGAQTRGGARGRGPLRGRGRDLGTRTGRVADGPLGGGGYSGRVKSEYGPRSVSTRSEDGTVVGALSSDESDTAPRYNIDDINYLSDSDEEGPNTGIGKGKAPAKASRRPANRGLRPVRVERRDHVERIVDINTEASSIKSAERKKQAKKGAEKEQSILVEEEDVDGLSATTLSKDTGGTMTADGEPQIKEEPTDGDVMMVDDIPHATDEAAPKKPIQRKKKQVAFDDPRSKLQTAEERQEFDRHEEDLEYLRRTLGNFSTAETKAVEDEEKEVDKEKIEEGKDERQGKLFLFQFPPMTPNLTVPTPQEDGQDDDAVVEMPPPTSQQAETPRPSQASPPAVTVKTENDNGVAVSSAPPASSMQPFLTATNSKLPPGRVGKLQVHKSGATTIDWGGISLKLDRGSDVGFLQDAVVVSEEKTDRKVWAMSQVSGKWVVTPDWDKLLDE